MPLKQYIEEQYGGNQAAFARAIGKPRQQVNGWLDSGNWYVYGGCLYQQKMLLPDPRARVL
ncbi:hypothetical protein HBD71_002388 [Salmonella enterica]|nr:hypothetical protein [Salmonella enterica]EEU4868191.1 hypothetical protein [Salmonella enterica]